MIDGEFIIVSNFDVLPSFLFALALRTREMTSHLISIRQQSMQSSFVVPLLLRAINSYLLSSCCAVDTNWLINTPSSESGLLHFFFFFQVCVTVDFEIYGRVVIGRVEKRQNVEEGWRRLIQKFTVIVIRSTTIGAVRIASGPNVLATMTTYGNDDDHCSSKLIWPLWCFFNCKKSFCDEDNVLRLQSANWCNNTPGPW